MDLDDFESERDMVLYVLDAAARLYIARERIGLDDVASPIASFDPFGASEMRARWLVLYREELDELQSVSRQLGADSFAPTGPELESLVGLAYELERTLFAADLMRYVGAWVATKGNEVVASAPDHQALLAQVRSDRQEPDLMFLVTKPDDGEE